jgi:peptidoglycan/xylan/chitin deacetylase (PgdA/CDA1 family)
MPNPTRGWGPGGKRAALSLSFDNLGEAAEMELGRWPGERPVGSHASVTRALPRLLEALGGVRATFFVEGWNGEVYPDALRSIADAGHEVALHGWRHERWRGLTPELERELLARACKALGALGLSPRGFRPPGGSDNADTPRILESLGLVYRSPEGDASACDGAVARLAFRWRDVDAYWLDPVLAALRERRGDGAGECSPADWLAAARASVDDASLRGAHRVLVFHPYLLADDARMAALERLLDELRARADLWITPCADVADWMRASA